MVSYYRDKLSHAQSGCVRELESEKRGSACDDLDNLERLVYEVAYSGGAETLYRVLRVSAGLENRGPGFQIARLPSSGSPRLIDAYVS